MKIIRIQVRSVNLSAASPATLNSLYRDHHGWLLHWLWRKLGCRQGAADLAQDTFMRVLCADTSPREPRAFLHTVAKGLLVNHWRRLQLERDYLAALAQRGDLAEPSPEDLALITEVLVELDRMLGQLSPRARQAFLLAQLDGMAYADIAVELGVSERMVKKYMAQAMLQCALALGEPA